MLCARQGTALTEDDVWDEEQSCGDVVLVASEAKVLIHAFNLRIANVGTVDVREKIQYCHDGDESDVNLCEC